MINSFINNDIFHFYVSKIYYLYKVAMWQKKNTAFI